MKVHNCAQKSPEWFALRKKCFLTASELAPWMTKSDATARKSRETFLAEKLAAPIYDDPTLAGFDFLQQIREKELKSFDYNIPVQRGNALEPEARAYYARKHGVDVAEIGFITDETGMFGASPDGLIHVPSIVVDGELTFDYLHGLEIKCPIPETHIKWLRAGEIPDQHKCQVHGSMAITGLDRWDFISFCPGVPSLLVTVTRDDYTDQLLAGMKDLFSEYCIAKAEMAAMWQGEYGNV